MSLRFLVASIVALKDRNSNSLVFVGSLPPILSEVYTNNTCSQTHITIAALPAQVTYGSLSALTALIPKFVVRFFVSI